MILLFDMGLPMIMPTMYFMVAGLIPIVLVEALYLSKSISVRFTRIVGSVAFANIVSTLVGLPLTWLVLFLIQIVTGGTSSYGVTGIPGKVLSVTLQAPWLLPFGPEEFWVFHAAALFLLIPFFIATWLLEYVLVRNKLAIAIMETSGTSDVAAAEKSVFRGMRNANLISYGMIAILLIISLIMSGLASR
jgi:hypothetical protein